LSSFMRDLKVDVHGHGYTKLGHAYGYGGGELLTRTLNDNYGLDIKKYIAVNYSSFEKIIDLIGGLQLDINMQERDEINRTVKGASFLENAGVQLLDGKQTLAYSRIRRVGQADFERTERQRKVLEEIINKLLTLPLAEASRLAGEMDGLLEMNLDQEEAFQLFAGLFNFREEVEIINLRFPIDGTFRSAMISGVFYLIPLDANETKELIRSHVSANN